MAGDSVNLDPVPVHRPALWEGGCPDCTAVFSADPEYWMAVSQSHRSIDWGLQRIFARDHAEHDLTPQPPM